jgi:hypothetical protein
MMAAPANMPEVLCQQALERVLTYLADDGIVLSTANCRQALRLVEGAIGEEALGDEFDLNLPARCVGFIPDYFECFSDSIPDAHPPLARGFIGYD